MSIAIEHGKWRKDRTQWLSEQKRMQKDRRKAIHALNDLERLVKRHNKDIKAFEKKIKAHSRLNNGQHSSYLHKKLKKIHLKQKEHHSLHARARKNLIKMTKELQSTLRRIH